MPCLRPIGYTSIISSRHGSCDGDKPVIRRHLAREERVDLVRTKRCQKIIRERSLIALSMKEISTISNNVSSSATAAIELRNATKRFLTPTGQAYTAIRDVTLSVAPGEFCAVVGPTGSGKSTTLSLISGLAQPSEGEVEVMGKPVQGIDRRIGYVFQADAVFPWKNVLDNVATGPLFRGQPKAEALQQAHEWIARVGLIGFEHHYPHQLSGGMRKRVSLAQTFINQPQILLMDEPFSSLDVQTRLLMEDELLHLWSSLQASVVFVTHDLEEAISLADKVVVLTAGPATVKGVYPIDLPRPRKVEEIRFEPRFVQLYHEIWEDLRNEVLISYERNKQRA
jgi:NitT/TauT family transport system ATP-binding protein